MTLGVDIQLDTDSHDVDIVGGDLVLTQGNVAQAVKIAVLSVRGDWYFDRSVGVPYYEDVFTKPANLDHIRSAFRRAILAVPGVGVIKSMTAAIDAQTRALSITWQVDTDDGEISGAATFDL